MAGIAQQLGVTDGMLRQLAQAQGSLSRGKPGYVTTPAGHALVRRGLAQHIGGLPYNARVATQAGLDLLARARSMGW